MNLPNIAAAALDVLRGAGLLVDSIAFDGKLHRCPTQAKPKGKNGCYVAHEDAPASLWWRDWRSGEEGTWTAKGEGRLTPSEREALTLRMEESRKARKAEEERRHKEAAEKAKSIYDAAVDCTGHPYLTRKRVQPVPGLKVSADPKYDSLIVPVVTEQKELAGLQFILPDKPEDGRDKNFLTGTDKTGHFFPIGGKDTGKPLLICEGVATGLSLHECLELPVLVAFDAGNLLPVAELARRLYPEREIILCADYDDPGKGYPNPGGIGVAKATEAALAIGGSLAVPHHEGRKVDWNDLHRLMGAGEVRAQFMNHRKPEARQDGQEPEESRILPPPPPVPLEAFPDEVQIMLKEASETFTVPMQIPVACLLAVLSCLVGGTRLISLRSSWKEPGNIWIVTVAASGIGKTPCATAFFSPIKRLEYEAFKQWRDEYATYENELELVRKERTRAKRGESMPERPIQPKRRQAYVDDATVEALGEVLSENPRGIMWRKDELAGLIADLDKYSSGNSGGGTRSRLLSSYDGQEWKTSRTSDPRRNLYIPHAFVGIFGGIQPAMLPKVFEAGASGVDEASGFLQRFILIRAEREKPGYWTERSLSQSSKDLIASIVAALWAWDIEYDAEGREVEKIVPVSRQAKAAFIEWFNAIAQQEFLSQNAALLSKLKGQAQRLCLLLHSLDAAIAGTDGMNPVTEGTMRRGLLLANWAKEHQEQCWRFFTPEKGAKQADPIERAIMAAVVEQAARIEADGWRIKSADLHSMVENKMGMKGLPKDTVAKAASSLGLGFCFMDRCRARSIQAEKISSFKKAVVGVVAVAFPTVPRDCTTTPPVAGLLQGVVAPYEATPADNTYYTCTTPAVVTESLVAVRQTTPTTATTPVSGNNPVFDFNDPAFPDEVTL
jgi:phage/plasmid primase-like uncharacterized protein